MNELYRLDNIRQEYAGRTVLQVDSLSIAEGSVTGIAGPNGAGKSTLLRLLALLENPVAGRVLYEGKSCEGRQGALRREITLLPQEPYLLHRSVEKNVAYGLMVRGKGVDRAAVYAALDLLALDPASFAHRQWYELSGGEAQRVALAARLIFKPRVLLLDEPTTSLDEQSVLCIRDAALAARRQWGTTLVIISHDTHWLDSISDHTVYCRNGQLTAA